RGNVERVVFVDGAVVEGELRSPVAGARGNITNFRTILPVRDSEQLVEMLSAAGVTVDARLPDRDWWTIFLGILPWLLIIGFWIFIARQMQAGGAKAFQFGKSKAKLLSGDTPKVTFDAGAGV